MITARTQRLLALALAAAAPFSVHANCHEVSDDAHIASAIDAALDAYPSLGERSSLQVQAIGGVVYLHGLVDTYPEKALVQSVAARTPGVERVVNSLELRTE